MGAHSNSSSMSLSNNLACSSRWLFFSTDASSPSACLSTGRQWPLALRRHRRASLLEFWLDMVRYPSKCRVLHTIMYFSPGLDTRELQASRVRNEDEDQNKQSAKSLALLPVPIPLMFVHALTASQLSFPIKNKPTKTNRR